MSANRNDLAAQLDCIIIPEGTEVVPLDTIGTEMREVIWEKDGQALQLWSSYYGFRHVVRK